MTYLHAALTVLAHAERPLTVGELTAVAVAHGLVRPRGKTPDRSMSSVLYRRMAADPDAPVISRQGRFWLRGRPLPAAEAEYLGQPVRHIRAGVRRPRGAAMPHSARHTTPLPPPPLRLSEEALRAVSATTRFQAADYAPTRRERAIARAGERGARLLERLEARRSESVLWDVAHTEKRLVTPLLAHLGYRGETLARLGQAGRSAVAYVLHAGGAPAIALLVRRLAHDLTDDDAWRALGQARQAGARYAGVSNGRELRVYAVAPAEAQDDVAAALIVVLDLAVAGDNEQARSEQAAALWLLSRTAVAAGALDAYTLDRVVGATLLGALETPQSALARELIAAVQSQLGVSVPANFVLRHARLVLREARGREGEPLPADIAAVAAVRGPLLESPAAEVARSA
jgi:hypothetical protein